MKTKLTSELFLESKFPDFIKLENIEDLFSSILNKQFPVFLVKSILLNKCVKINSKYKEDDFSDSNADVNSLNVCVHRKQAHHM